MISVIVVHLYRKKKYLLIDFLRKY